MTDNKMRAILPNAPDADARERMVAVYTGQPGYEGGARDLALVQMIRDGKCVFWMPDGFRMTKQGFDFVGTQAAIQPVEEGKD